MNSKTQKRRSRESRKNAAAVRLLATALRRERDALRRKRLRVVTLFCQGKLTARQVAAHTRIPRSTAYSYWRLFREKKIDGLLAARKVGRPEYIPPVVRERFEFLSDPIGSPWGPPNFRGHRIIYAPEREQVFFNALGLKYSASKISRWLRRFTIKNHLLERVLRFRKLERAYDFMHGYSWRRRLGGRNDAASTRKAIDAEQRADIELYRIWQRLRGPVRNDRNTAPATTRISFVR